MSAGGRFLAGERGAFSIQRFGGVAHARNVHSTPAGRFVENCSEPPRIIMRDGKMVTSFDMSRLAPAPSEDPGYNENGRKVTNVNIQARPEHMRKAGIKSSANRRVK